ncbi:MAG: IS1595 family transposase [Desulfomonile tiedjei]|nr:IS1595 family transposase [Desulfomonile tiedjei]
MKHEINLATLSPLFADEEKARKFLEEKRWPNGPICPHCGHDKVYAIKAKPESKRPVRAGVYTCAACRKQFTVRIGTVFEDSHIPLNKWLMALHLMTSSKKGISSLQLSRELGVTIKTAWFLSHRIREAMIESPGSCLLKGTVEVDECYVGGKTRQGKRGRGSERKTPVVALVERNGRVRSKRIERVDTKTLKTAIRENVDYESRIMTDEWSPYQGIGAEFVGGHEIVNHGHKEYVRGDAYTNTVESFFALLKRGHYGIFHSLSKQHLQRYANEFSFRWNYRKVTDGERMVAAIEGAEGKRLMYRESQGGISRN